MPSQRTGVNFQCQLSTSLRYLALFKWSAAIPSTLKHNETCKAAVAPGSGRFYGMLQNSSMDVVGMTREDCAGYAADAYARVNGIGAVCVTYCVGGLSLCNSIAGAYAEKSPVVVISGAPGIEERRRDPLLHHRVRDFNTQYEVFEKITVDAARLEDPLPT